MQSTSTITLALLLLGFTASAYCQPDGPEFRVNTTIRGDQEEPSIAMDADGNFIIVWASSQDPEFESDIYARRFDLHGAPVGDEFRVSTHRPDIQQKPAIAIDRNGNFFVAWQSWNQHPIPNVAADILGQRFDSFGDPIGMEFAINVAFAGPQQCPSLAVDATGEATVVWDDNAGLSRILARRYDATGAASSAEFPISVNAGGFPDAAATNAGEVVVVWLGIDPVLGDGILAQLVDTNGDPTNTKFLAGSTTQAHSGPSVAVQNTVTTVAWERDDDIFARMFDTAGHALGSEFRINEHVLDLQAAPDIASDPVGGFVAVWQSKSQDGSGDGIYGRRFLANGAPMGQEFPINTHTADDQTSPVVAAAESGFVVAWSSRNQDGAGYEVYARRFDAPTTPVLFSGLRGERLGDAVRLIWTIEADETLNRFDILRTDVDARRERVVNERPLGPRISDYVDNSVSPGETYDYRVIAKLADGGEVSSTVFRISIPSEQRDLRQNTPNPFNPSTEIAYAMRRAGHVELTIHDASGKKLIALVSQFRTAGTHVAEWDGRDAFDNPVSSGVYFYVLHINGRTDSKKMVLLK